MYCPQCGVQVADDSKFCFKCGTVIPAEAPSPVIYASPKDDNAAPPEQFVAAPALPPPPRKPQSTERRAVANAFTILAFIALVGMYFTIIGAATSGIAFFTTGREQTQTLLFGGLCFWWLFKIYGRNKWIGGVFGVIVTLCVLFAGVVLEKRTKGSAEYLMEHTPAIAAVKKNHPDEYAQIAKSFKDLAARGANPDDYGKLGMSKLAPIAIKAIHSTSDTALAEYGRTRLQMFRDVAANNAEDCVMLMLGDPKMAQPIVTSRVLSAVSEETKVALLKAVGSVIEDEGKARFEQESADDRFRKLYKFVDSKLKPTGISAFDFTDDTKSSDVRCKAGLGVYGEVMSLPVPDRSFMLRYMLGPG